MLIRRAEVYGRTGLHDVRLDQRRIAAIGTLTPAPDEDVLDAAGGCLLPGLHDHHVHLLSYAASLDSVRCGPPDVTTQDALAATLNRSDAADDRGWIRGIGYHESVAGDINRQWLDRHGPARPIRIQHRSGRLWVLNSAALSELTAANGQLPLPGDGRLYDQDVQLRSLIGAVLPPVAKASRQLAAFGVTGLTDMTPHNSNTTLDAFRTLQAAGALLQRVRMAGAPELGTFSSDTISIGETKIHFHEADLPPFDDLVDAMRSSHARDRAIAVHCVTETELVFTLAAIREAGSPSGDRIEHASVTPPALLEQIRELGLTVVTQPNFVEERGDTYLADLPADEHAWLYRCRTFLDAGVPLAGGTDTPFGHADPWRAMRAAVTRRTRPGGRALGAREALSPEQALQLFLGSAAAPALPRAVGVGEAADLCLLTSSWADARRKLSSSSVAATIVGGSVVWARNAANV